MTSEWAKKRNQERFNRKANYVTLIILLIVVLWRVYYLIIK